MSSAAASSAAPTSAAASAPSSAAASASGSAAPSSTAASSTAASNSTAAAAPSSTSALPNPVNDRLTIVPLVGTFACSSQYVRWSYQGTQSSSANLTIFTSTSNFPSIGGAPVDTANRQVQIISDNVPINANYFLWSPVNVPAGSYQLYLEVPGSGLNATSSLFNILYSSNTKCLSTSDIKGTGTDSQGEIGLDGSSEGTTSEAHTIAPAVVVPLVVLGLCAFGFFFWRRRQRQQRKAMIGHRKRASRFPAGESPYQDEYADALPKESALGKGFLGKLKGPRSPRSAALKGAQHDDASIGESYALKDNASVRRRGPVARDRDTWSEFGGTDRGDDASSFFHDVEEGNADGELPTAPAGAYGHTRRESAVAEPAVPLSQGHAMSPSASSEFFGDHLASPDTSSSFDRANAHKRRKPVPALRDSSAAYSAAEGGLSSPVDANPFADPQAPPSAFTMPRHHEASAGLAGVLGKQQHQLDVADPADEQGY